MELDGNGTTIIRSPFRKGDFVHQKGQSHQLIKFMGCYSEGGMSYLARNCLTNKVVVVNLPVMPPTHKAEDDYFQITELNEDNEATIRRWSGGGTERRMKVLWDEDVELIKDGLKMEDKEVFCTIMKVMGKEVMGDIKFMDKDPSIMKTPDLVMDIIFSKLSLEDRLNSRLVIRRWGLDLFPINKFLICTGLELYRKDDFPPSGRVDARFNPQLKCKRDMASYYMSREMKLKDFKTFMNTSLFQNVGDFSIESESGVEDEDLQTLLEECRKITDFQYSDDFDETDPTSRDWVWAKKFVSANKKQLDALRITTSLRVLDLKDDLEIGECTSLRVVNIVMSRDVQSSIRNLECLPSPSLITHLSITKVSIPFTKSQIIWIANHLSSLIKIELDVHHNHSSNDGDLEMDDDEVDESTIKLVTTNLRSLWYVEFYLGPLIEDEDDSCDKAKELLSLVNQNLGGWRAYLLFDEETGEEFLGLVNHRD